MSSDHAIESRPPPGFASRLHEIGLVVDLLRLSGRHAIDEIAPLIHPEMRVLAAPGIAPARPYRTREDFLEYFADAHANGVLIEPDAREMHFGPLGELVVAGSLRMTSRAGVDEIPAWFVYTFRDGLIASLATHLSADLAEKPEEGAAAVPGRTLRGEK